MIDPESPVTRAAVFGKQVEMFIQSDIGVYLLQCAQIEVEGAMEKLKDVDPEDPKSIRELQNKIKVAESIVGWLNDAIKSGQQATEHISEAP